LINHIRKCFVKIHLKLHVEGLNATVNKWRENWKCHIQQLAENKIPAQMMDSQLQGIRSHRRSKKILQGQTYSDATGPGV
jgi:hypothetical protein